MDTIAPVDPNVNPALKWCPGCQRVLAQTAFRVVKHTGRLYTYCGECSKAKRATWQREHLEQSRATSRAWKAAHPEWVRAYTPKTNAAHARARQADPVRTCAVQQAINQRRRARLAGNGGTYTPAQWLALKARYGYCCLRCGKQEPEITLTVDHVVPIALGGPNNIGNLQPLCLNCNLVKGARWEEYRNSPHALAPKRQARRGR